jgi:Zn finger protein HypA/HybF involved in hydrogenase expression
MTSQFRRGRAALRCPSCWAEFTYRRDRLGAECPHCGAGSTLVAVERDRADPASRDAQTSFMPGLDGQPELWPELSPLPPTLFEQDEPDLMGSGEQGGPQTLFAAAGLTVPCVECGKPVPEQGAAIERRICDACLEAARAQIEAADRARKAPGGWTFEYMGGIRV